MNGFEPLNVNHAFPVVPERIERLRLGVFGIQYDFSSRAIQKALPDGWGSTRCMAS